ncbi:cyclase dehydrase [Salinarimonas sp. NSM]|uniref:cyclase dehydrase n=1 Tax=Salinarimonas sp. NSM TaxID=3458003 RepID=UPI004035E673
MRYESTGSPRRGHPDRETDRLARGLGLFSIALGVAELAAAPALARAVGIPGREGLVRACGAREVATGVALLAADDPAPWMWARVAGDALDLGLLATGLDDGSRRRERAGLAMGGVAAIALLDLAVARTLAGEDRHPRPPLADYRDRRGFPRPPEAMRGVAREAAGVY